MGARKLLFPIVLALVWLVMAAMAMVDFASFNAATTRRKPPAATVKVVRGARTS
jgi:hypothetical protein